MDIVKENPKENRKYDPQKRYRWAPEANFAFSGGEFGVIVNALRQVLSTKEAQTILMAERASELVELSLARAVEDGTAYEEEVLKK